MRGDLSISTAWEPTCAGASAGGGYMAAFRPPGARTCPDPPPAEAPKTDHPGGGPVQIPASARLAVFRATFGAQLTHS
eukprot:5673722-Pyramimonas_sp.AAC.1